MQFFKALERRICVPKKKKKKKRICFLLNYSNGPLGFIDKLVN